MLKNNKTNANNFLANIEIIDYDMRLAISKFMALQFLCEENMSKSNKIPFSCDKVVFRGRSAIGFFYP